jgi:ABC-type Fe3+-hydroxamate transport system substrate-binding protein
MPSIIYQNNLIVPAGLKSGRIVSLVPSQTELLFDIGLDEEVIGITKFCVHPNDWFINKTRIGGTKTVDIEKIKALQPDLILANKEENIREQVEALSAICPIYVSDVATLDDALEMIQQVGILVNKELKATEINKKILEAFAGLNADEYRLSTTYLIWRIPYMTAGGDTYISDMMELCGFENVFVDEVRYPEITIERLQLENCQLLLLSSEPYPFKEQHIKELQLHLPNTRILLADGEMFSWFGSRLLHVPAYFKQLQKQAISF